MQHQTAAAEEAAMPRVDLEQRMSAKHQCQHMKGHTVYPAHHIATGAPFKCLTLHTAAHCYTTAHMHCFQQECTHCT
jgi:hypothetical protein